MSDIRIAIWREQLEQNAELYLTEEGGLYWFYINLNLRAPIFEVKDLTNETIEEWKACVIMDKEYA